MIGINKDKNNITHTLRSFYTIYIIILCRYIYNF